MAQSAIFSLVVAAAAVAVAVVLPCPVLSVISKHLTTAHTNKRRPVIYMRALERHATAPPAAQILSMSTCPPSPLTARPDAPSNQQQQRRRQSPRRIPFVLDARRRGTHPDPSICKMIMIYNLSTLLSANRDSHRRDRRPPMASSGGFCFCRSPD